MLKEDIIQLDIGGSIFRTTRSTLSSVDGYFSAMFRNGIWAEENTLQPIFIDRDPTTFPTILSYLRSHQVVFSEAIEDLSYLKKLAIEADYYQLTNLTSFIEYEFQRRNEAENNQKKEVMYYKIVKGNEVSSYFSQGWSFVHQYYGNETFGCIGTGTRVETIWFGNHCVACNELMNYEKFLKHTTLFQPVMFVIMKKSNAPPLVPETSASQIGNLTFDQSFG